MGINTSRSPLSCVLVVVARITSGLAGDVVAGGVVVAGVAGVDSEVADVLSTECTIVGFPVAAGADVLLHPNNELRSPSETAIINSVVKML
jgi:hypothetical protein